MITFFQAFVLGLVQGLTEFLPVSSSAHLVFFQHLLGLRKQMLSFDVFVHVATLTALLAYFAEDLLAFARDTFSGVLLFFQKKSVSEIFEKYPGTKWTWGIIAASVPTAAIGFLFKDWFESMFGSLMISGVTLVMNAGILWLTRSWPAGEKKIHQTRFFDYFLIGILQGIAIIPGISRSTVTLAGGLWLGLERETAFRFAFLISIPAILGASVLEFHHGIQVPSGAGPAYGLAFFAAALSGYLSLRWLSGIVRKGELHLFAFYTVLAGAVMMIAARWFE